MHAKPGRRLQRARGASARRGLCFPVAVAAVVAAIGLADLLQPFDRICWGSHERPTCLSGDRG